MNYSDDFIRKSLKGIILKVLVQPKSSINQIVGPHGDEFKIKLTAPPVGNAANRMVIQFLAKQLAVPKSAIEIKSGQTSRHKQLLVNYTRAESADSEYRQLKQRLLALLPNKKDSTD